jgi:hypothetical protein
LVGGGTWLADRPVILVEAHAALRFTRTVLASISVVDLRSGPMSAFGQLRIACSERRRIPRKSQLSQIGMIAKGEHCRSQANK